MVVNDSSLYQTTRIQSLACYALCLKELWVEYGTGEKRSCIHLHSMADKMGESLCRVVVKADILTGDDITSRIGTKLAAMQCNPTTYPSEFAERKELQNDIAQKRT